MARKRRRPPGDRIGQLWAESQKARRELGDVLRRMDLLGPGKVEIRAWDPETTRTVKDVIRMFEEGPAVFDKEPGQLDDLEARIERMGRRPDEEIDRRGKED